MYYGASEMLIESPTTGQTLSIGQLLCLERLKPDESYMCSIQKKYNFVIGISRLYEENVDRIIMINNIMYTSSAQKP